LVTIGSNQRKIAGWAVLILLAGSGCSMDEGFNGIVPLKNIFLDERGCLSEEAQSYSSFIGFDVTLLDVTLEVYQASADLTLGVGDVPMDYFSVGRGPGTQRLRVGPGSRMPIQAGTWFVGLSSPAGVTTECDPENPTDFRLVMNRTGTPGGTVLLEENCDSGECAVPACTPLFCDARELTLDVPEDASRLEVVLESVEGDADLFFLSDTRAELGASMNPGTGFDILELGPDVIEPLRGLTVFLRLESWAQTTDRYNLRVAYTPGP
jgi:hypothetical protein